MTLGRVLVVDRDRASCEMLEEALTLRGFTVRWATSIGDALAAARQEDAFDVVLTDYDLRTHPALDLWRELTDAGRNLPVVVVSAFRPIATWEHLAPLGVVASIIKPFDLDDLARSLRAAVLRRMPRQD